MRCDCHLTAHSQNRTPSPDRAARGVSVCTHVLLCTWSVGTTTLCSVTCTCWGSAADVLEFVNPSWRVATLKMPWSRACRRGSSTDNGLIRAQSRRVCKTSLPPARKALGICGPRQARSSMHSPRGAGAALKPTPSPSMRHTQHGRRTASALPQGNTHQAHIAGSDFEHRSCVPAHLVPRRIGHVLMCGETSPAFGSALAHIQ